MNQLKNLFINLNAPIIQNSIFSEIVIFIPRFICGFLLAKDFGADKFGMPWTPEHINLGLFEVVYWFPKDVAEYGGVFAMFPIFFAWMGAFSEAVGGIFLAIGLKTRIAAFLIACTMLVAIFGQKWDQGVWGMLPAMGFLWVSLYSLILGSGRLGLDYLIYSKLVKK